MQRRYLSSARLRHCILGLNAVALSFVLAAGCESDDQPAEMNSKKDPKAGDGASSNKNEGSKEPDWPAPKKKKNKKPAVNLPKDHPCWNNKGKVVWEKTLEDRGEGTLVRGLVYRATSVEKGEMFVGLRGYWEKPEQSRATEAGFGLWSINTEDATLKWSARRVLPRLVEAERPVGLLRLKGKKLAYTTREVVGLHNNEGKEIMEFAAVTEIHQAGDGKVAAKQKLDGQMEQPKGEGPVARVSIAAPDGGVLVIGNTDKSGGEFSNNMPKLFFQKLDADLKVQSLRYYELVHLVEKTPVPIYPRDALYLRDGTLAVLAEQHRTPGAAALVLMRFSADLKFLGENFFGWTTNVDAQRIYLDQAQQIYLAGTFGELPQMPKPEDRIWNKGWVAKLDRQGNPEWSAVFPAPDSSLKKPEHQSHVTAMAVDPVGNIWVAGVYSFHHPEAAEAHQQQQQVFVRKIDADGLEIWNRVLDRPQGKISHDHPVDIRLDDQCNGYVLGNYVRSEAGQEGDDQRPFLLKIKP